MLKGDQLECFNETLTIHWSISCKGNNIVILDQKDQSYFEMIKMDRP